MEGEKRVQGIPHDRVEEVKRRVAAGQAATEALAELLTADAPLLVLERKQRARKRKKRK